jgi:D-glycero-alpha-D-manno-heptose-7-phosphate kinase
VEPLRPTGNALQTLFDHILMFWTGHQRDASVVLAEQKLNMETKLAALERMRDQAAELQNAMSNGKPLDPHYLGAMLDEGWQLKRSLAKTITSGRIDEWYDRALRAGAVGGKLAGAGGGGCMLFIVPPEKQPAVRAALSDLIEVPVDYEVHGSRVLLPPGD